MSRKHAVIMVLCCLVPLVALVAISILRVPANTVIYVGIALVCPLMHLLVMRGMQHGPEGSAEHAHHQAEMPQTVDYRRP